MKKLLLCLLFTTISATESKKPTIVSCYSSMSSKSQKHEITLSDGTRIVLKNSIANPHDLQVTISQQKTEGKK